MPGGHRKVGRTTLDTKTISNKVELPNSIQETVAAASENGYTPLLFASDEKYLGMIAVADEIKEDSAKAISELRNLGVHTVMLTGDNPKTAGAIGKLSGVDEVVAGVLPDGKEQAVKQLMDYGKVIMVGDGSISKKRVSIVFYIK